MSHIATVRTSGDYKSSTSKDQTYPQNNKEIHPQHSGSTQVYKEFTTQTPLLESRPESWDLWERPITLPLRPSDCRNQMSVHHIISLKVLSAHAMYSSFGNHSIEYSIHHFFTTIHVTTSSRRYSADTLHEDKTRIYTRSKIQLWHE